MCCGDKLLAGTMSFPSRWPPSEIIVFLSHRELRTTLDTAEWVLELTDTLTHSGHGLAQMTVATFRDVAYRHEMIEAARGVASAAGWRLCELSARNVEPDPAVLPESGFVILRDVDAPLPMAVPVLIGAFQHLVQRDLPVGLLVVATTRGTRALRLHQGLGFLSRAETLTQA